MKRYDKILWAGSFRVKNLQSFICYRSVQAPDNKRHCQRWYGSHQFLPVTHGAAGKRPIHVKSLAERGESFIRLIRFRKCRQSKRRLLAIIIAYFQCFVFYILPRFEWETATVRRKLFSVKFCFSTLAVEYNRAELKYLIWQLSLYCGIEAPKRHFDYTVESSLSRHHLGRICGFCRKTLNRSFGSEYPPASMIGCANHRFNLAFVQCMIPQESLPPKIQSIIKQLLTVHSRQKFTSFTRFALLVVEARGIIGGGGLSE